jgi:uncharacterized Zn ribbon protein
VGFRIVSSSGKLKIECPKCGYEWTYTGKLDMATCPNCSRKVKVQENGTTGEAEEEDTAGNPTPGGA